MSFVGPLTIHIEIIIRHIFTKRDSSTAVIAEMEYSGFDSKPS